MKSSNDISIVFITRNRQRFFSRQIQHWTESGVSLVIVDGSDNPWKESDKYRGNLHLTYIWSPTPPIERLRIAAGALKTSYVVMCQEEDFLLPTSISKSISIMECQPHLVAVSGEEAYVRKYGSRIRLVPSKPIGMRCGEFSLVGNPDERTIKHFSNFAPRHYYSMMRCETFKKTVACLPSQPCSWSGFIEFVVELAVCLQGASLHVNMLTRLSRSIFDHAEVGIPGQDAKSVEQWLDDSRFSDERSLVIEELSALLRQLEIGDRVSVELALHAQYQWLRGSRTDDLIRQATMKKRIQQSFIDVLPDTLVDLLIQFRNVNFRKLHPNRIVQGAQIKKLREGTEFDLQELIETSNILA